MLKIFRWLLTLAPECLPDPLKEALEPVLPARR